jgi:FKBP-type peptidyl-prolyl cis-trans isomerase FkpA
MKKMKKLAIVIGMLASGSLMASTLPDVNAKDEVVKRESYAVGLELGKNVLKNITLLDDYGIPYDVDMLIEGIRSSIKGTPQLSSSEAEQAIKSINAKMTAAGTAKKAKDQVLSTNYLKENSSKEGVVVTESGLQYEVMTKGTGAKPISTDSVTVHYEGSLVNGKIFDSSYKRGEPASFNASKVIKGWTEGLQLMSIGSKYKFTIPADLAYGKSGTRNIPSNATLIFTVELLKIGK